MSRFVIVIARPSVPAGARGGLLIGADLWNLPRIAELGAPVVAFGGAGTFDGVFLTGILAGLLAAWIAPASRDPALAASH